MRSTWLGLAFTRFRYLTDFQETNNLSDLLIFLILLVLPWLRLC